MATAIFALVAVALAVSLNEAISAAVRLKRETQIVWSLDSRLAEARVERLVLGKKTAEPDSDGVAYEKEVTPLQMRNKKNDFLGGLYNIKITARWKAQNRDEELFAQTYVYRQ